MVLLTAILHYAVRIVVAVTLLLFVVQPFWHLLSQNSIRTATEAYAAEVANQLARRTNAEEFVSGAIPASVLSNVKSPTGDTSLYSYELVVREDGVTIRAMPTTTALQNREVVPGYYTVQLTGDNQRVRMWHPPAPYQQSWWGKFLNQTFQRTFQQEEK
ncbi:MAG: hypothetical protein HQL63_10630 [Magnetococcales bacterium]|nr:hypothetical protein [Magnetococcales bacterium]MBF0322301.1 hypothetical protein [Magnetococcales bacterium]